MKATAFALGVAIGAVGAIGFVAPSTLVWLAGRFLASGAFAFHVVAAVRIALGLVVIAAAPASRAPRALRVLGIVIVILGLTTAVSGLVAIEPARRAIEAWMQQGSGVVRLAAAAVLALGAFLAYACAPSRSAP